MRKTLLAALPVAAALILAFALLGEGSPRAADTVDSVVVTNFPESQKVEIEGTPSQAELVRFEREVLGSSTGRPDEWRRVGVLDSSGFSWVVLSLGGEVQGPLPAPGAVTAVLVPDVGLARRALEEDGVLLFPLQTTATLAPGHEYFSASSERLPVAFPRYGVYLYNTGARSVEASLYAYLGN